MTALTLLGWAGAICLAVVLAAITVLVVVAVVREVRKPSKTDSTIIGKDRP
ncbi:hypothetical protein [Curtobacterium sp. MCBD17_008]|uniref:hypothetical protein n=1 Tax=Curtobacterium sp. MCBD17_008 TaxID=2175656 RepID=UPI0015E89047|nr:hypothetical protein [Curtobacterium sp. MCBD17_008]